MNKTIHTVRGTIAPEKLGFCQPHEHLFTAEGPAGPANQALPIDDIEKSAIDAVSYRDAGGRAVVDAQPLFTGRDAAALKQISEKSDIHIIASTGFHNLFYYSDDNRLPGLDEEELTAVFIEEIRDGMYADAFFTERPARTDIRAGQIKSALEKDFTDTHKRLFTAAASASAETGAPVMIHVDKDAEPLKLMEFFGSLGVEPDRQIYCHMDRAINDISVHKEIAKAGAYVEYDTIARPKYHSDEIEKAMIFDMLESGFEGSLLMSLDMTRARLKGYGGAPGLDYILKSYIPELKKAGVDGKLLDKIFIGNPAEAFAFSRGSRWDSCRCGV